MWCSIFLAFVFAFLLFVYWLRKRDPAYFLSLDFVSRDIETARNISSLFSAQLKGDQWVRDDQQAGTSAPSSTVKAEICAAQCRPLFKGSLISI